jgi:hypothetical protein
MLLRWSSIFAASLTSRGPCSWISWPRWCCYWAGYNNPGRCSDQWSHNADVWPIQSDVTVVFALVGPIYTFPHSQARLSSRPRPCFTERRKLETFLRGMPTVLMPLLDSAVLKRLRTFWCFEREAGRPLIWDRLQVFRLTVEVGRFFIFHSHFPHDTWKGLYATSFPSYDEGQYYGSEKGRFSFPHNFISLKILYCSVILCVRQFYYCSFDIIVCIDSS